MEANTQLINYNLMASLRTGTVIVDMAIAMFIPQLMNMLVNLFNMIIPFLERKLDTMLKRQYRRTIVHSYETDANQDIVTSNRNSILQNAIREYIGRVVKASYSEGIIKLTKIESAVGKTRAGSVVEQLESAFQIIHLPTPETMEELEPGLFFSERYSKTQDEHDGDRENDGRSRVKDGKSASKTVVTMAFESSGHGSAARVNGFIDRAYAWYLEQVERDEVKARFMYQPLVRDRFASIDDRRKARMYKRYELSSDKTFSSLFFPEKDRLLSVLEHFTNKTGKYAIRGFPHKLGLLLHGPPGTGKTSLVKAMAHYTNRNIVAVPLSRITTNQELMDVMFDEKFNFKQPKKNADEERCNSRNAANDIKGTNNVLSYQDVIFLLEDIDAASDVVHARTNGRQSTMARKVSHLMDQTCNNESMDRRAPTPRCSLPPSPTPPPPPPSASAAATQEALLKFIQLQQREEAKIDDNDTKKKVVPDLFFSDKDKLSLAGLLTVLDGVVDTPGRILIMTTNHPDRLDPALTRPGRVNMQLYMGFIGQASAKEMVRHYYKQDATDAKLALVDAAFEAQNARIPGGFKISPAEMEQLCAECCSIDDLLSRIGPSAQ